jgi:hypothetical protein
MAGSCPYCGAKLNYGIRFCVVCGRPINGQESARPGSGLRSGIRPADVTRRLEDLMTVAKFKHSKRAVEVHKRMRWLSFNIVSVAVGVVLFFVAVKISIDGGMFKKNNSMISPFAGIADKIHIPFENIWLHPSKPPETSKQTQTGTKKEKKEKKKSGRSSRKRKSEPN